MISTPAAKISSAVFTVMPEPPAEFSPLATTRLNAVLLPQLGNKFLDRAPARLPYDVRDEQQFHAPTVTPAMPPGKPFRPPREPPTSRPVTIPPGRLARFRLYWRECPARLLRYCLLRLRVL